MRFRFFIILVLSLSCFSCKKERPAEAIKKTEITPEFVTDHVRKKSADLLKEFPFYPHLEPKLWRELTDAEFRFEAETVESISTELRKRHPFLETNEQVSLGGIRYDKKKQTIDLTAEVHYPDAGDDRHPGELEVILCSEKGRIHETLFVTEARPLHLEILMHLAGFKKSEPVSSFNIELLIPNHSPIAVKELVRKANGEQLELLRWKFTGADFNSIYKPDLTGDFIICWNAHEAVLSSADKGIASGETKLKLEKHPALKQGMKVKLVLAVDND